MHPPVHYVNLATKAEDGTHDGYLKAADLWCDARTASIGHGRRARYEYQMNRCLDLAAEKYAEEQT